MKYYLILLLAVFSINIYAENLEDLNYKDRIRRLERLLNPDLMLQQKQTIQVLREEVSALREQVEQQEHMTQNMKLRQKNLYLDIDRRISHIESGANVANAGLTQTLPVTQSGTNPAAGLSPGAATVVAPTPSLGGIGTSNSSPPSRTVISVAGEQDEYNKAFSLLKNGQYEQSIVAFEAFKVKYPQSQYADNAQYWLGEANYVLRQYEKASASFNQLLRQYPNSAKVPGAQLKIAYIYYELQSWSAARESLQQIVARYPQSSTAKKASERLARMKREAH